MTIFKKDFGLNMKVNRKANNFSQEELAELSFVTRNYIGNIERGEKNVSLHVAINISKALNVDLEVLCKKRNDDSKIEENKKAKEKANKKLSEVFKKKG